jgi:hypothetical protein
MRGGGILGFLSLVAIGGIIGDLVAHPKGTAAGLNGTAALLGQAYSTTLGGKKVQG